MYLKLKDHNKCFTIILNYVSAIPPQLRHLLGEKSVVVGCLAVAMGEHTLPQGGGGELICLDSTEVDMITDQAQVGSELSEAGGVEYSLPRQIAWVG